MSSVAGWIDTLRLLDRKRGSGLSASRSSGAGCEVQDSALTRTASGNIGEDPAATLRSRAELIEEVARLREAVAARDAFLAVAPHELRNPMTPIFGRVERLRRLLRKPDFRPEALEKSLEQIESLVAQ